MYAVEKKNNRGHYYLYKETTLCRENGKGGFFFYASSEKNLGEKKEPSSLEQTSFLLRFCEHRDSSQNVFLVVIVLYIL